MLVFGAGTDYALLLTARYREELRRHEDRHEAMALAMRRAGPAIIASAGTVILGLLTLSFAELNSTKSLGPVLAIGVAVALLSMMTLLPALLLIFGRRIFWPVKPTFGSAEPTNRGFWARVGRRIAVRPRVVWVVTALILGVMALGLTGLKASGLTAAESFVGTTRTRWSGRRSWPSTSRPGRGSPWSWSLTRPQAAAVARRVQGVPGITGVTRLPVTSDGYAFLQGTLNVGAGQPGRVHHHRPGPDGRARGARRGRHGRRQHRGHPGHRARGADHDRNLIIPIILLLVFVILGLLLRAMLAPMMLIATVVLSFAAALGVSALFFNHVFHFGNADNSFPLFVFVFLVALGIDYNIFLMTRVREEAPGTAPRRGALTGLVRHRRGHHLGRRWCWRARSPRSARCRSRSWPNSGFAVAFGVLLDTLVVRSVLVTALNLDLGRWVWWPSKLYREPVPEELEAQGEPRDDPREEEPTAVS